MESRTWWSPSLSRTCAPAFVAPSVKHRSLFALQLGKQTGRGLSKQGRGEPFVALSHGHVSMSSTVVADPELHAVLELATNAELYELSNILYGQSLLSPLLKSVTRGDGPYRSCGNDHEDRGLMMQRLGSRFLFLGADAKAILRGQRPTYRDILLCVQVKLRVPCSTKISTEDLEAEIFLHLLQVYSRKKSGSILRSPLKHHNTISATTIENFVESESWRASLKMSGAEMWKVILRGGSVLTISALQRMVSKKLGGKVLIETARYQVTKEVLRKGGKAVALNMQARIAMLAARQGLVEAASSYLVLQRTSLLLGPLLWGTFLAEMVIKSVGTDYARVVRAIYLFAQIRLLRTYGWTQPQQSIRI